MCFLWAFFLSIHAVSNPTSIWYREIFFVIEKDGTFFSKIKCYTMLFSSTYNQICNAIYFKPINLDRNRRGFGKWREISPIVSLSRSWGFRKSGRKLGWASHWKKNFQQPLLPRNSGNVIKLICNFLNIWKTKIGFSISCYTLFFPSWMPLSMSCLMKKLM